MDQTSIPDQLDTTDTRVADIDQAHEEALAERQMRKQKQQANDIADGLLSLASLIKARPDLVPYFGVLRQIRIHAYGDNADDLAVFARAAMAGGATIRKNISSSQYNVAATWGPVEVEMLANRDEVCERVVTGVETVTEQVPDPELLAAVPTVEVTREVETVEWVCRPLLATEQAATGTAVSR